MDGLVWKNATYSPWLFLYRIRRFLISSSACFRRPGGGAVETIV